MEINSEQEPVEKPVEEVHTGMNKMLRCVIRLEKQNAHLNTDDSQTDSGHMCCKLGQAKEAYIHLERRDVQMHF